MHVASSTRIQALLHLHHHLGGQGIQSQHTRPTGVHQHELYSHCCPEYGVPSAPAIMLVHPNQCEEMVASQAAVSFVLLTHGLTLAGRHVSAGQVGRDEVELKRLVRTLREDLCTRSDEGGKPGRRHAKRKGCGETLPTPPGIFHPAETCVEGLRGRSFVLSHNNVCVFFTTTSEPENSRGKDCSRS